MGFPNNYPFPNNFTMKTAVDHVIYLFPKEQKIEIAFFLLNYAFFEVTYTIYFSFRIPLIASVTSVVIAYGVPYLSLPLIAIYTIVTSYHIFA